jgi:hypothetical protein
LAGAGIHRDRGYDARGIARLQAWACEAASEFAFDIACDVARNYSVPRSPPVDDLPCDEVVVEWNSPRPTL